MGKILIHDKATSVSIPKVDVSIAVSDTDDLREVIQQLIFTINNTFNTAVPGCYNELYIACDCTVSGLMIGTGINHKNVTELFKPLKYKVGTIIIQNKNAAFIYSNGNNGVMLCKRMALCVFANVIASASVVQPFDSHNYSETLKAAEGFTLSAIWNCTGKITTLNKYDENGKILYSVNHIENNTIQLLFTAASSLHHLTKSRLHTPAIIYKKIVSYCNQVVHYLHSHAWKFIPAKHS